MVPVPARAIVEVQWTDAIRPNAVDPTNLKEEILFGFADVRSDDTKVLDGGHGLVDAQIQRSWEKPFSRGALENVRVQRHPLPEVTNAVNKLAGEDSHGRCASLRSRRRLTPSNCGYAEPGVRSSANTSLVGRTVANSP